MLFHKPSDISELVPSFQNPLTSLVSHGDNLIFLSSCLKYLINTYMIYWDHVWETSHQENNNYIDYIIIYINNIVISYIINYVYNYIILIINIVIIYIMLMSLYWQTRRNLINWLKWRLLTIKAAEWQNNFNCFLVFSQLLYIKYAIIFQFKLSSQEISWVCRFLKLTRVIVTNSYDSIVADGQNIVFWRVSACF